MRLDDVTKLGQSIWLDFIRRHLLTSGELRRLVEQEGVRGVTSNPSIFRDAIAGSTDYDAELAARVGEDHAPVAELYTDLVVEDIQGAADVLRPVYRPPPGTMLREPRSLARARARHRGDGRTCAPLWRRVARTTS